MPIADVHDYDSLSPAARLERRQTARSPVESSADHALASGRVRLMSSGFATLTVVMPYCHVDVSRMIWSADVLVMQIRAEAPSQQHLGSRIRHSTTRHNVLPACQLYRWHVWYAAHTRSSDHRALSRKVAGLPLRNGTKARMCLPAQRPHVSCGAALGRVVGIGGARSIRVVDTQAELEAERDPVRGWWSRLRSARVTSPIVEPHQEHMSWVVHGQMIAFQARQCCCWL